MDLNGVWESAWHEKMQNQAVLESTVAYINLFSARKLVCNFLSTFPPSCSQVCFPTSWPFVLHALVSFYTSPTRLDLLANCVWALSASFRLFYFFLPLAPVLLLLLLHILFFRLGGCFLGLLLSSVLLYLKHGMAFLHLPGEPALQLIRFQAVFD